MTKKLKRAVESLEIGGKPVAAYVIISHSLPNPSP